MATIANGTAAPDAAPLVAVVTVAGTALFGPVNATPAAPPDTGRSAPIANAPPTSRQTAASRRLVFVEANAPGVPIHDIFVQPGLAIVLLNPGQDGVPQSAAYPTTHDIRHLAAIDIVAHGAGQLGTAAPNVATPNAATPADDQTQGRPTETVD